MQSVSVFAPAKVNLTLHVTGRRDDGYHLLDSLVAFAPVGDVLRMGLYDVSSITVEGPEAAGVPADMDNLALRAAAQTLGAQGVAMTLTKRLPAASGIGGGSSDAAAAIRGALALMENADFARILGGEDAVLEKFGRSVLGLGADVPMCLFPKPLRARGIGEKIAFASLPPLPAVLVNPRVAVSTAEVFRALPSRDNPPMPDALPRFDTAGALIGWLATQRNDMEGAARRLAPEIGAVLATLAGAPGCGLARMSGSGATCFGLFAEIEDAQRATRRIREAHPEWWVAGGLLGDQVERAMPTPADPS